MNNKKTLVIIIVIILLAVTSIILGIGIYNRKTTSTTKEEPAKTAEKTLVEGHMTNIEETLRAQITYKDYRFKSLGISEQGPYYVVTFTVDNMSDTYLEHTHLNFTFLDSNKKVITETTIEIPELQAKESKTVEHFGVNKKSYDAFYFKVSAAKEATIPNKE